MQTLNAIAKQIDRLNNWIGRAVSWLTLVMILIGAYNAIVRYLGRFIGTNLSSNVYLELQWYLFSVIFLLGAAWTLKEDAHVRVDVLYDHLSARARRRINLGGTLILMVPFAVFVFWTSFPSIMESLRIREMSPDPGGLPRYPIKAVILVACVLLLLQGLAQFMRHWNEDPEAHGDAVHPLEEAFAAEDEGSSDAPNGGPNGGPYGGPNGGGSRGSIDGTSGDAQDGEGTP